MLERLVEELTGQQLNVFCRRVIHGESYAKIGRRLGISPQAAMFHYSAAMRKIGKMDWEAPGLRPVVAS